MDRRQTLSAVFRPSVTTNEAIPLNGGLAPYQGPWTYAKAAHLLRRAMFGPTHAQIKQAVADGLEKTVQKLLKPQPFPNPPVNPNFTNDPAVPVGSTWVDAPIEPGIQGLTQYRQNSLYSWSLENIYNEGVSITERMILFWHNHFVTSEINDARYSYYYAKLLREFAIGDFRELTKRITIDGAMLIYLNGNLNTSRAPNENYARELLELFTVGKGELAGPGDYTTFTEDDVLAMSKVLTGWTNRNNRQTGSITVEFIPSRHDTSTKKLSHRFNNKQIANANENEYKHLIDIIFEKREVATHLCRKLYRYFVYYKVNPAIENDVVEALADTLIASNFVVEPVLKQLLSSSHFFSDEASGCLIRSPYEFIFNVLKNLKPNIPNDYASRYPIFSSIWRNARAMEQAYHEIPSVAGWSAYYQEPSYHQIWINSVTLPLRVAMMESLVAKTFAVRGGGSAMRIGFDLVAYISEFDNPADVDKLLLDIVSHLLPKPIFKNQMDYLKSTFLGNTTAAKWTQDYNAYKANPTANNKTVLESRLRPLFNAVLSMPEFYLS